MEGPGAAGPRHRSTRLVLAQRAEGSFSRLDRSLDTGGDHMLGPCPWSRMGVLPDPRAAK